MRDLFKLFFLLSTSVYAIEPITIEDIDMLPMQNKIYVDEKVSSSNNKITIQQSGNFNLIKGHIDDFSTIQGTNNIINISQSSKSIIKLDSSGNNNDMSIIQGIENDSGKYFTSLILTGSHNTYRSEQSGNTDAQFLHQNRSVINGNTNTVLLRQNGNNDKQTDITINGDNNSLDISQIGTGKHLVDIQTLGNNHRVDILQRDNGTHSAIIILENVGGPSNIFLLQQGNNGQNYSITQQCALLQGCSVSVIQGN